MSKNKLRSLLETTKVSDVSIRFPNVVVIDSKSTIPSAFKTLVQNNIYSAPVLDSVTGQYLGFLDLVDIIAFIVRIFNETEVMGEDFYTLLEQEARFSLESTEKITDLSKRNPFYPVRPDDPLEKALNIFAKGQVHKLPVVDGNMVVGILSQSTLIEFLGKHLPDLGPVVHTPIQKLEHVFKAVAAVRTEDRAIEAFRLMAQARIASVGVLDADGSLLTTITAKDIRTVSPDILFTKLYKTAIEFVYDSRKNQLNVTAPAIWCHTHDTLESVIKRLLATKIHRMFIIDEHRKAIGVISLTDVFNILMDTVQI